MNCMYGRHTLARLQTSLKLTDKAVFQLHCDTAAWNSYMAAWNPMHLKRGIQSPYLAVNIEALTVIRDKVINK